METDRPLTAAAKLDGARFVLVGTRDPLNAGAAARALASTGSGSLWLVDPLFDLNDARRTAVGAGDVLRRARVGSLDEATEGCQLVATESAPVPGRAGLAPRVLAPRLHRPFAILFGDERYGLDRGLVARCDLLCRIPARGPQPSYNLAQAVLLVAYALMEDPPRPRGRRPRAAPADDRALESALALLAERARMTKGDAPARLLRLLRRAAPTPKEARLVAAAIRAALKSPHAN